MCAEGGGCPIAGFGNPGTVRFGCADGGMRCAGAASEVQERAGYLSEWVRGDCGGRSPKALTTKAAKYKKVWPSVLPVAFFVGRRKAT
jgi:hypothetical protein